MTIPNTTPFDRVVSDIGTIGRNHHAETLLANAARNAALVRKTTKDLPSAEKSRAIVVSAGPSLHRYDVLRRIKDSGFDGALVCIDGSFVKCLKSGLVPDYVLTLDPHPTRMVRWFGDPDFEKNRANDDYFERQDLDIDFRNNALAENQRNIDLVDKYAPKTKLIIASSAPENMVARSISAGFDMYWWNPLVDDPRSENSLTRRIYSRLKAPCMNTGGTVGTAAWVFTDSVLRIPEIALVGIDLGYPADTPVENTQTYYELIDHLGRKDALDALFPAFTFPLTGERYFTDPTYFWYRKNFLELLSRGSGRTLNCSEAGTLFGDGVECARLEDFLNG